MAAIAPILGPFRFPSPIEKFAAAWAPEPIQPHAHDNVSDEPNRKYEHVLI